MSFFFFLLFFSNPNSAGLGEFLKAYKLAKRMQLLLYPNTGIFLFCLMSDFTNAPICCSFCSVNNNLNTHHM